jgi:hypothetical protein
MGSGGPWVLECCFFGESQRFSTTKKILTPKKLITKAFDTMQRKLTPKKIGSKTIDSKILTPKIFTLKILY